VLKEEEIDLHAEGLVSVEETKACLQERLDQWGRPPLALVLPQHITISQVIDLPVTQESEVEKLIQEETVKLSGVSESRLGQSDVGIMGMEENVAAARAIAACTDMLLLADADTGYGNAVNVFFTVRGFEDAGLAGVMIEDQVAPGEPSAARAGVRAIRVRACAGCSSRGAGIGCRQPS
jgi:biopolymer transport protein ExbD